MSEQYALIDSGGGRKLEQFGEYIIDRPASQAVWSPALPQNKWDKAHAKLVRSEKGARWVKKELPESWETKVINYRFKLKPTDFGHVGLFAEHALCWSKVSHILETRKKPKVLNLFAHTGGATLACAKAGAQVCHVDAAPGMIEWAKENAAINDLTDAPIRWIVDDVRKFMKREIKRESYYDGIILDPPTFGRGAKNEVFKIDDDIGPIMQMCRQLLTKNPLFILLTCHTPGWTPLVLYNMLSSTVPVRKCGIGEMMLPGKEGILGIPSGAFAWGTFDA